MPIQNASDAQKVDYLWKKIVYGAAKTDIAGNIDATQEPVASPLQIRSDKILQDSRSIPSIIPASNSSVVTIYPTTFPVECISTAGIPTPTLTWQTGRTFWVPPEFGSTYQVKVYIAPSGNAANVASKGTQVFATGSGSNDLWVFDYQSGILNFNSNNTPYNGGSPISFTGNSVYISGAVYSGKFGIGNLTYVDSNITSNTDITISTLNNANIFLNAGGGGIVHIQGTDAFSIPSGNILARPTDPDVGYLRFNTELALLEYWNGSAWIFDSPAEITSQVINPDGTSNTYVLTSNATTAGVIVNINGTVQQPFTAYNVVGNTNIVFTEIPLTTDTVEVRTIATGIVSIDNLTFNDTKVYLDAANVNITGNLVPSANVTYTLGSPTLRWKTGYFDATTLDLGGSTIGVQDNSFVFTSGGTTQLLAANGVSSANTFISSTVTVQSNLAVGGNITVSGNISAPYIFTSGNISAQYIISSGKFLSELPGYAYSNVNIKAYTESMGFQNYGNANVSSFIRSYTGNVGGTLSNTSQPYITALGSITTGTWQAGTIGVLYGGTGATTSTGALTNLLPSGAATGYVLTTGGTGSYYWAAGGGGGGGTTVGQTINTLRQSNTATEGQTVFTLTGNITYVPGAGQLGIYINGVRQFPTEYVETSTNTFTLTTGLTSGDVVFAEINQSQSFNNYANLTYASNIGNLAAAGLTVQAAIDSLENNKAPLASPVFSGVTTVGGNLVVQGNLFVNGNLTTINANNLNINDSLIYLADDNPADTLDIGFVSAFTSPVRYQHTGFVRDATDGVWKLFANVVPEPTTTVDFTNASYSNLLVGNISAATLNSSGNIIAAGGILNNLTVNGNIVVSSAYALPSANASSSLGTSATRWNFVYGVSGNFLSINANYADLAEIYTSDQQYPAGTVVIFGGEAEITQSTISHDTRIAGIISTNPAYLMNNAETGLPVALQGRVPCQVLGPIHKGDRLAASSIAGVAKILDIDQYQPGCIIGKALQTIETNEIKLIEVVVGRL